MGGRTKHALSAFHGGVDAQTGPVGAGEGAGEGEQAIEGGIGAAGVMMKEDQMSDAGIDGLKDYGGDGAMSPALSGPVFGGGVLGVVDEEVGLVDELADGSARVGVSGLG